MLVELVVLWLMVELLEAPAVTEAVLGALLETLVVTESVTVALIELCERVTEADCVVVPLEFPVAVALTGPTEKVELGRRVLVPLLAEASEDEGLEVDEALIVIGAVGPEETKVLLELPYGAPLEMVLEEIPPEGTNVENVKAEDTVLLLKSTTEESDKVLVGRGAVGPTVGALPVLFP